MKTRVSFCVLIALMAALLTGCTELFEYNLWKSDVKVEIGSDTTVDELKTLAESPDFYAGLAEDDEKKDEVLEFLDQKLQSEDKAEVRDAALLTADIYLKTDPEADQTVSNLVEWLLAESGEDPSDGEPDPIDDGTTDPEAEIKTQLESLLPPAVIPPATAAPGSEEYTQAKTEFVDTIISLANAGAAFEAFGNSLEQNDDGTSTAPDGVEIGSVAQTAAVCIAAEALLDTVAGEGADEAAKAATVADLFDYLYGGSEEAPFDTENPPDFTSGLESSTALLNIFEAAGISMDSLMGGSSETEGGEL